MSSNPHQSKKQLQTLEAAARTMSRSAQLMRSLISEYAGMNATEAEIIDYILEAGPTTSKQLAQMTRLSKSTLSTILTRLETRKFIVRQPDATDLRKTILVINPEQLDQRIRPFYQAHGQAFQKLISAYSAKEITFLIKHYQSMTNLYEQQVERLHTLRDTSKNEE